ncbi:MAG: hypothetical protein ACREXO_14350 [Advenella sp.]
MTMRLLPAVLADSVACQVDLAIVVVSPGQLDRACAGGHVDRPGCSAVRDWACCSANAGLRGSLMTGKFPLE